MKKYLSPGPKNNHMCTSRAEFWLVVNMIRTIRGSSILVLIAYAKSGGPEESENLRSLTKAFAARTQQLGWGSKSMSLTPLENCT